MAYQSRFNGSTVAHHNAHKLKPLVYQVYQAIRRKQLDRAVGKISRVIPHLSAFERRNLHFIIINMCESADTVYSQLLLILQIII